jgi:hypothetical protein
MDKVQEEACITAAALMVKNICAVCQPPQQLAKIEERLRYLLRQFKEAAELDAKAAPAQSGEPVAWRVKKTWEPAIAWRVTDKLPNEYQRDDYKIVPLYAAPQPAQTAPSAVVLDDERAALTRVIVLLRQVHDGYGSLHERSQACKDALDTLGRIKKPMDARAASPQATATLTVADILAIAEDCSAKDGHLDVPAFRSE